MEPTSDKHYESKWESPLWKMIKEYADKKDVSYNQAWKEVSPVHFKMVKYRDTKFEDEVIRKRNKEIADLREREKDKGVAG
jgi:hypothetical protein